MLVKCAGRGCDPGARLYLSDSCSSTDLTLYIFDAGGYRSPLQVVIEIELQNIVNQSYSRGPYAGEFRPPVPLIGLHYRYHSPHDETVGCEVIRIRYNLASMGEIEVPSLTSRSLGIMRCQERRIPSVYQTHSCLMLGLLGMMTVEKRDANFSMCGRVCNRVWLSRGWTKLNKGPEITEFFHALTVMGCRRRLSSRYDFHIL